ncbi:22917_t:CDS:2, partial [Dentiscutata erythropus]
MSKLLDDLVLPVISVLASILGVDQVQVVINVPSALCIVSAKALPASKILGSILD